MFSRLILQTRKNQGLFGKGLITPFVDFVFSVSINIMPFKLDKSMTWLYGKKFIKFLGKFQFIVSTLYHKIPTFNDPPRKEAFENV